MQNFARFFFLSGTLRFLCALCVTALTFALPALSHPPELKIAAASDLQFVMSELAQHFEKQTGIKLSVSYGSSGNFFSQIQNGAPFDVFFSADIAYPSKLEATGLSEPASLLEYAQGKIVLWVPKDSPLGPAVRGWDSLLDPRVRRIAIGNPTHAPYGRAALIALQKAGIYDQIKSKLVYGENISQTAQFVESGSAQIGIIAYSLALSPSLRDGNFWKIPANLYPPIAQAAVILSSSKAKESAKTFLQFVKSAEGRGILAKYGFQIPKAD